MLNKSILTARLMQVIGGLFAMPKKELRFSAIPKRTLTTKVSTSKGEVKIIIYLPKASTNSTKPPVYVNFHGGGFVIRNPESDDPICRYIADKTGCFVVNVDYDVGPQRPFPVAPIQAYEVVQWVIDESNASEYGWDASKLVVGGQSAGGNLAAGVCLSSLEKSTRMPQLQVLFYPPLDIASPPEEKHSPLDKPLISSKLANIFNAAYTPNREDRKNPLASPLFAENFSGLPQSLIITAELDTLRDEGGAYASALSKAGVKVDYRVIGDVDHAFTHTGPVDKAKEALALVAETVRNRFNH